MKATRPAERAKSNFCPPTQIFVRYRAEGRALFGTLKPSANAVLYIFVPSGSQCFSVYIFLVHLHFSPSWLSLYANNHCTRYDHFLTKIIQTWLGSYTVIIIKLNSSCNVRAFTLYSMVDGQLAKIGPNKQKNQVFSIFLFFPPTLCNNFIFFISSGSHLCMILLFIQPRLHSAHQINIQKP